MADRVELAFRRAARELLPRDASVLVAVSGGGDSVALLHLLVGYAKGQPLELAVAHLDHGLRRESAEDRKIVERMAQELGLPCFADRRPVKRLRRKDESPEEAARRVRRSFLLEAAEAADAAVVATGHTLDDQAETILMRLVRGAGPTALTGMAAAGPGPFVRPLLAIERSELRAYLARRKIRFLEDASNDRMSFDRNRVRHLVLPLLSETLNPRTARHLVDAAERLREDAMHLDEVARRWLTRVARKRAGALAIPLRTFAGAPSVLRRRIARLALEQAGADPRRISARHVEALLDLAGNVEGKSLDLPGGIQASVSGEKLVLR